MKKSLVNRLNDAIEINGARFGPSLTYLLLHSKMIQSAISPESRDILIGRKNVIRIEYINHILPKTKQIVNAITGDTKNNLPDCRSGMSMCFQRSSDEKIRQKLMKDYKKTLPFALDSITLEGMKRKITDDIKEDDVKYYLRANNRYVFSYRFKEGNKIAEKIDIKQNLIPDKSPEKIVEFATIMGETDKEFWINYKDFKKQFSDEWLELMIGDFFGLRIVDTNQNKALENMEKITNDLKGLKIPGFINIRDRFDDHNRYRIKQNRPGGIHLTLVDTSLRNHPIEVQYVCLKSEILNRFGEYAHKIYQGRGKKSNGALK